MAQPPQSRRGERRGWVRRLSFGTPYLLRDGVRFCEAVPVDFLPSACRGRCVVGPARTAPPSPSRVLAAGCTYADFTISRSSDDRSGGRTGRSSPSQLRHVRSAPSLACKSSMELRSHLGRARRRRAIGHNARNDLFRTKPRSSGISVPNRVASYSCATSIPPIMKSYRVTMC